MTTLTFKEKINALFDEDLRQKLYDIVSEETDPAYAAGAAIRLLQHDLNEWVEIMKDEFPD